MKFKRFLIIFSSFILIAFVNSCSNLLDDSDLGKIRNQANGNAAIENGNSAYLSLSIDGDSSRTALPTIDLDKLTYISLSYYDTSTESQVELGSWSSLTELKSKMLPFRTGNFTFNLVTIGSDLVFVENKNFTIKSGKNNLSFTPKLSMIYADFYGKGNLNVSIRYDGTDVKKVTAGLFSKDGSKRIAGYSEEELEILSGGNSIYSKTKVPSGNYLVIFRFYADEEKTQLLGSYREYAIIIDGLTSASECEIESLGSLFSITYELNGGAFVAGGTIPGSYTRRMNTLKLPVNTDYVTNVEKSGYVFGGWYDNENFTGEPITEIPAGSIGDKIFYAKWLENSTIVFNAGENASIVKNTVTVTKNETARLPLAIELGLNPGSHRFYGWATTAGKTQEEDVEYADGADITVSEKTFVLYAVVSAGLNPDAEDNTDTDGDGISDYNEINVYFTDPQSKDTDGDGWDDGYELSLYNKNTNTFNPLIADTPELGMRMTAIPSISYKYSDSSSQSASDSSSTAGSYTGSSQSVSTNTKTHSETSGWSNTFGGKFGWNWAVDNPGGFFEIHDDQTFSGSTTSGDSYTYSQAQSSGWSQSWSNGRTTASSSTKTVTGGTVMVPVRFKNPSRIAYSVEKVTVALYRIPNDVQQSRVFVTNLTLKDASTFTILPESENGDFSLSAELGIGATEKLLKYSSGFEVEVSGYKITLQKQNQYANDFTETLTTVRAKTATLYIDWGSNSNKTARTYNVSVKNRYDGSKPITELYTQPDLEYVLEKMLNKSKGSSYKTAASGSLNELDGIKNQTALENGAWFISHKYTENDVRKLMLYSPVKTNWTLSDIKLSAGDEVAIIYSVDKDKDGLPLNEELINGTSDENTDTDGDGLSDYEEVYGWYKSGIGLASKYSESNKVYTNPKIRDTDGDDYPDYSKSLSLQDSDPIIPKSKSDTSLGVIQYRGDDDASFMNFTFINNQAELPNLCEGVYLNIVPSLSFAVVRYSKSSSGPFMNFDSSTRIELNVGDNDIYIQCTAPDETTKKVYKITARSDFRAMKNFKVTPLDNAEGFTLTWDNYSDSRAMTSSENEGKSDGGYILYGVKQNSLKPVSLILSNIAQAKEGLTGFDSKDSVFFKLSAKTLKEGILSLSSVSQNTNYSFYLFAYAEKSNSSKYKNKLLASVNAKSTKTNQAVLAFYGHYFKSVKEHDSGSEGEYFWNVSDSSNIWGLEDLSRSSPVDMNDNEYFCFGEQNDHGGSVPSKFGKCTKTFTKVFNRGKDYSFTIKWSAMEDDDYDDWLGDVLATFKYDSKNDKWTCSWSSYGPSGEGVDESGSYEISIGQRSLGNNWQILNTSSGEVELYWDWSWDYESLSSVK